MQFKQNASVYTVEGKEVGRIDRVVLNPRTLEVTHIVVRNKGLFFTDDKVIPIQLVGAANEAGATLRPAAGDLRALPDFEGTRYVRVSDGASIQASVGTRIDGASPTYWIPVPGGVPALDDPNTPRYVPETKQNIPDGAVALKTGAKVMAADGILVGRVEEVMTDPEAAHIRNLVISQGLLVKEMRQVPMVWVGEVWENEVHLLVSSRTFDQLGFRAN
jgi:sporulation protein YlmC with PRC-barrel domain